jgi:hypothetical protein
MLKRFEDWLLARLQKRCQHPDRLCSVDILEGDFEEEGLSIGYCNRCGAVKVRYCSTQSGDWENTPWRTPSPNLWRKSISEAVRARLARG